VSLQLFGHPFSSYTWKVLTALSADEADETPSKISCAWPRRRSDNPLLVDGDRSVVEATDIA